MVGFREDVAPVGESATTTIASAISSILPRRILFHPPLHTSSSSSSSSSSSFSLTPLNDIDPLPSPPQPDGHGVFSNVPSKLLPLHQRQPLHQHHRPVMVLDTVFVKRIGSGLSNLGNTCFLNSVLQCLTYTPPLAAYLQADLHKGSCRIVGFCAMCAMDSHVKQALSTPGRVISPNHLVKNLRSISRSFQMWRQEDAHEYMRYLIEALQKCCPKEVSSGASPSNYIQRVFGGRLRSQVKCTQCSHCSNTYDPFLDLSLEIVRAESLVKALSRFTAVEVLDGNNKYQCTKCKKKVRAFKRFTIDHAPHVLTIQFKRFSSSGGCGGKIDKKVQFDRTLDIKPFVNGGEDGNLKYSLYAVLVHSGWSTHSGHYYCFVRTATDMWHVLDDSRVSQVSEKTVLDQKAYMLFYMRDVKTSAGVVDCKKNIGFDAIKTMKNEISVAKPQEIATGKDKNSTEVIAALKGVDMEARKDNGKFTEVIMEGKHHKKSVDVGKENGVSLAISQERGIDRDKINEAQIGHPSVMKVDVNGASIFKAQNGINKDTTMIKSTVFKTGYEDNAEPMNSVKLNPQNLKKLEHEPEEKNGLMKSISVINGGTNSLLNASLETTVPSWDDAEKSKDDKGSLVKNTTEEKPAHCGYLLDEWDEEYDRGKRKRVRNKQISEADVPEGDLHQRKKVPGKNPFQAIIDIKSQEKNISAQVCSNPFQPMDDTKSHEKMTLGQVSNPPFQAKNRNKTHEKMPQKFDHKNVFLTINSSESSEERTPITRPKKHRKKQWTFGRKWLLRRHRLNKRKPIK